VKELNTNINTINTLTGDEMKIDNIISAWNAQADEFNQWSELDANERVEFAIRYFEELDKLLSDHIGQFCVINGKTKNDFIFYETKLPDGAYKLYAEPPVRKPLSDQEVMDAIKHISFNEMTAFNIARALEDYRTKR
jgi:hypothetical protein